MCLHVWRRALERNCYSDKEKCVKVGGRRL